MVFGNFLYAPSHTLFYVFVIFSRRFLQAFSHRLSVTVHMYTFYFFHRIRSFISVHRWIVYRTNSWGYLKNGTFDGMIGAMVRKEIDVGGSPIFFRSERAKVIDYTASTWKSR